MTAPHPAIDASAGEVIATETRAEIAYLSEARADLLVQASAAHRTVAAGQRRGDPADVPAARGVARRRRAVGGPRDRRHAAGRARRSAPRVGRGRRRPHAAEARRRRRRALPAARAGRVGAAADLAVGPAQGRRHHAAGRHRGAVRAGAHGRAAQRLGRARARGQHVGPDAADGAGPQADAERDGRHGGGVAGTAADRHAAGPRARRTGSRRRRSCSSASASPAATRRGPRSTRCRRCSPRWPPTRCRCSGWSWAGTGVATSRSRRCWRRRRPPSAC